MKSNWRLAAAAGAIIVASALPIAHADVKITSEVTTEASSSSQDSLSQPISSSLTIYLKGNKARTETQDGRITIFDEHGNVFTMDASRKTYEVTTTKKLLDPKVGLPPQVADHTGVDSRVDLTKVEGATAFADKNATRYSITASVAMHPESGGGYSRGGMGGGGFPGG